MTSILSYVVADQYLTIVFLLSLQREEISEESLHGKRL